MAVSPLRASTTTTDAQGNTVVVPRVIPLFINDVVSSPTSLKLTHYRYFFDNLKDVFKARVEVEDLMVLYETMFAEFQAPLGVSPEISKLFSLLLQILIEMFCRSNSFQPVCTAAMLRLSKLALSQQQEQQQQQQQQARAGDASAANADGTAVLLSDEQKQQQQQQHNTEDNVEGVSPIRSAEEQQHQQPAATPTTTSSSSSTHPLFMDVLLTIDYLRPSVVMLWRAWDLAGVDVCVFSATPQTIHLHLPTRLSSSVRVYRDFAMCPPRPKLTKGWGPVSYVHVKTNIPAKSDVMYRLLVEGYNYGVNAVIFSDVVGYTNRRWEKLGEMTQHGWPEGWDSEMANDYAPGCAISQYYSSDKFVVVKLRAKSFFCVGFSVSAWLVFHGYGNGFPITAEFFHQDDDL